MFLRFIDAFTGHRRIAVKETERVVLVEKGEVKTILMPGEHRVNRETTSVEVHMLDRLRFDSAFDRAIFRHRPDLAEAHLMEVTARPDEVAIVFHEDRPVEVLLPEKRAVFLKDAGPFTVERLSVREREVIDPVLHRRLIRAGFFRVLTTVEVAEGHVGMMAVDGVFKRRLAPGRHGFFIDERPLTVRQIDLRTRTHEVTGQEILSKDRVTIRVNLMADFRVADPERALTTVKTFEEALHRAVQLAFRRAIGAMTLDQVLTEKDTIDAEAAKAVRAEMARIGIEVGDIALKDVILPGEMRDILTAVVAAEKEAEANVIRRREETNATRSLLNTAKVMADNPVLMRLKELEALEAIAGKVQHLTVHNGTQGLMTDVAQLRDT
jgi:regulator of protease activity HflC (stomatin/prohibitin superfamily)